MEKTFTITMPNEPFKSDTSDGKTATLTYFGSRYIVISVNGGVVQAVEGRFDNVDQINLSEFVNEDDKFYIIDAVDHTLIASFLTHSYTNEEVAAYEETLPDDTVYDYPYPAGGLLDNVYDRSIPLTYNAATGTFSDLQFLSPLPKAQWDASVSSAIARWSAVDTSNLSEESAAKVQAILDFFNNIETNYPGVDYWKIPFPKEPPIDALW